MAGHLKRRLWQERKQHKVGTKESALYVGQYWSPDKSNRLFSKDQKRIAGCRRSRGFSSSEAEFGWIPALVGANEKLWMHPNYGNAHFSKIRVESNLNGSGGALLFCKTGRQR